MGFVYKWINKKNQMWYIGSHDGQLDDGYVSGGTYLKIAMKKQGIQDFTREILYEGEEFREQEAYYLNLYDAKNNNLSYNKVNGSKEKRKYKKRRSTPRTQAHKDSIGSAMVKFHFEKDLRPKQENIIYQENIDYMAKIKLEQPDKRPEDSYPTPEVPGIKPNIKEIPPMQAFGIIKKDGMWIAYDIKFKGDRVLEVNYGEPNVRMIAQTELKVKLVDYWEKLLEE